MQRVSFVLSGNRQLQKIPDPDSSCIDLRSKLVIFLMLIIGAGKRILNSTRLCG